MNGAPASPLALLVFFNPGLLVYSGESVRLPERILEAAGVSRQKRSPILRRQSPSTLPRSGRFPHCRALRFYQVSPTTWRPDLSRSWRQRRFVLRSTDTRGPLFEYFSQELDRRLPSPRFRLRMQSSFGCFVADSSFARKAVLRVTVKVDLPVHLRESHFFSKCNHTFQWHHRVGITVQDEDLGHDSPRFHSHSRSY
jgi:hypothetical protein